MAVSAASGSLAAAAEAGSDLDRQAIRAAGEAYQEALAKADVAALSKLWVADGDLVDEQGRRITAKDLLAAEAAGARGGRRIPSVRLSETRLRFLSGDVAIEDGTAEVSVPDQSQKVRGRFTAGWVRTKDGWKLSFLREAKLDAAANRPNLAELEPLVGNWRLAEGDGSIRVSARWNRDKTFLLRDMTIKTNDDREIELNQRIGIDPLSGQIHSWNFSSDGGHGEGHWTRDGNAWVAQTTAVTPNGTRTTSFNVYSLEKDGKLRWRSFPTSVTASHTPPVDMVFVKE